MPKTTKTKILLRNDTAANWAKTNPILGKGEAGVEVDTGLVKFGDGVTHWNDRKYGGYTKQSQLTNDDYTVKDKDYSSVKAKANAAVSSVVTGTSDGSIAVNGTDVVIKGFGDLKTAVNGKAAKATTLAGYGISDAYTKAQTDSAIASAVASVFKYRGTKDTVSDLPSSGQTVGDVYFVSSDNSEYAWNGTKWEELGPVIDLSHFITSITIAGITLSSSSPSISKAQLQSALGLGNAAYKNILTSTGTAPSDGDTVLPTMKKVQASIDAAVSDKIKDGDTVILDCGNSTTEIA